MSERLTAVFENKLICAFELTDENGQYIEEVRSELRIASQSGTLFCPECQTRLILCAGAVREPYFRHFSLEDCQATFAMRTASGRRSYHCRRMLYSLAKRSGCQKLQLDESRSSVFKTVSFASGENTIGYVYLDGRTRNYQELRLNAREHINKTTKLVFFLPMKYQSNGINLTSDEVEISRLNRGIIYYIDYEKNIIAMRKQYTNLNGVRESFCMKYKMDELEIDSNGEISGEFLKNYNEIVCKIQCSFKNVKRIPIEEGIDEVYSEMDFVCMDSYNEIWILPRFLHSTEEDSEARENRKLYLQQVNEAAEGLEYDDKENLAYQVIREISQNRNSWDW